MILLTDYSDNHPSIDRFNALITLEAEYAGFGRKLAHSLEDCVQVNSSICEEFKKAIAAHDRKGSQKMPRSLFSDALPASLARYK